MFPDKHEYSLNATKKWDWIFSFGLLTERNLVSTGALL